MVMLVSLGASNLSVSKSELETKGNSSIESKMDIMLVPEDITADGVVDIDDLAICVLQASQFCSGTCTGDLNGDSLVDLTDIIQLYNYIISNNCN